MTKDKKEQIKKIAKRKLILVFLGMVGILSIISLSRKYPEISSTTSGTILCILGMVGYGFFIYVGCVYKKGDRIF